MLKIGIPIESVVSLTKYVKMASLGVPPQSVRNKMKQNSEGENGII
jgi:hypothetical protein